MLDIILDTLLDALKILPFLFLTYLVMEYVEHKASHKLEAVISSSNKYGPVLGGLIGAFPQCGFSVAASNFYAGGMITLGTLLAVFLSTSDEMLPLLISNHTSIVIILKILGMKMVIGIIAGYLVDLFFRNRADNKKEQAKSHQVNHICESESCRCKEQGIIKSAVTHTIKIILYIMVMSFCLNVIISLIGEEALAGMILSRPFIGPVIAGIVGLIPNCAASIVITGLYLEGILGVGSMMAGLLVGAGVGLLILFRVNDNIKENLKITGLLYGIGVTAGILIELVGLVL